MLKEDQLVVVHVGDGFYGISVNNIREIVKPYHVTIIPNTPSYVEGLMNLRGQIVTVINLMEKLACSQIKVNRSMDHDPKLERIVIINYNGELIGLRVNAVEKAVTIKETDLELPEDVSDNEKGIIEGVIQIDDTLVMKLNIEQVLQPLSNEGGE